MNYRVLLTLIGAGIFASDVNASLDGDGRRGHDEHTSELSGQYDPKGPFPTEDGMAINETPDSVERGANEHKGVRGGHHKMKHKKAEAEHKAEEMKAEGDKADEKKADAEPKAEEKKDEEKK